MGLIRMRSNDSLALKQVLRRYLIRSEIVCYADPIFH
jgi:hypothetical protein